MTDTVSIHIKGMTCGHCENAVAKALQTVVGVKKAEVSLDKEQAIVEVMSGTSKEDLIAAVEEEGYEASIK